METFLKIYGLIIVSGILAATFDVFCLNRRKEPMLCSIAMYSVLFFYAISLARTVSGNGQDFLSFSFWGKDARGYSKVVFLMLVVMIIHIIIRNIANNWYELFLNRLVGLFSAGLTIYIVLFGQPKLIIISIVGIVSIIASAFLIKNGVVTSNISLRNRHIALGSVLSMYSLLYYVVGPSELFAYNSDDFIYTYSDIIYILLLGSILFVVYATLLISNYTSDRCFITVNIVLFVYCVATYIQSMFLNGKLNEIDGSVQDWALGTRLVNVLIWILITVGILLIFNQIKTDKTISTCKNVSIVIGLVQLVTFAFLFLTTNMVGTKSKQVLWEDRLTISPNENAIIFILDAYDVQMIDKVLEEDSSYLNPLHDFTYFNNMTSVYTATDGSLPYLLTANETDKGDFCANTHFLNDIKNRNYDISILTDGKYVDEFDDGLISNYSDEWYCSLDVEKTMDVFARAMRFKGMPYVLKRYFKYEEYDLTNIIADTNIYIMGTDDVFDDKVIDEGLDVSCDKNALRIYHLYGAHAPYFMDENADLNYDNSNPVAQWKGCLKLVYDYIDELKKNNKYDDATIIIMADHGINRSQRSALDNIGMDYDRDKSNPIFFIKTPYQHNDVLTVDNKAVTHRQFFDTLMMAIDSDWNVEYQGTIWD